MEDPEHAALCELITKAIELCTDNSLLDLIYKLLNDANI